MRSDYFIKRDCLHKATCKSHQLSDVLAHHSFTFSVGEFVFMHSVGFRTEGHVAKQAYW